MRFDRFRSKGMVYFLIGAFLLLISADSVSAGARSDYDEEKGPVVRVRAGGLVSAAQQEEFETLMADGKRLYDDMENDAALQKFHQARALAVTQQQKSDVYFYLSLIFYGLLEEGRTNEFTNAVNMLIEVDYYRQLDPQLCPQRYIEMYQEIKKNYGVLRVRSAPAGADVFINDDARSSGTTPLTVAALAGEISLEVKKGKKKAKGTIEVVAGEEIQSPEYELKGKSSAIYIIGGVLLAAGVGAAVALGGGGSEPAPGPTPGPMPATTGSIQFSSNPAGATIFFDGSDTGNVTPYTLSNIAPGDHSTMLAKEGYVNFEGGVSVVAGQTAVVNPDLQQHVVTIVTPDSDTTWIVGSAIDIVWEVDETGASTISTMNGLKVSSNSPVANSYATAYPAMLLPTSVTVSHKAGRGRTLKPSTFGPGNRGVSSSSRTGSTARSRTRRLNPMTYSRTSIPSQGTKFNMMGSLAAMGAQVISNVKIDLYKAGELIREITPSMENAGDAQWEVPNSLENGSNYRIRISVASDPAIFFESEKFTIWRSLGNIVTNKDEIGVFEDHNTTFLVKLSRQPASKVEVTVKRVSGDSDVKIASGSTLTFTKTNWNTNKKVTLFAAPDGDTQNGVAVVRLSADGIAPKEIEVTEVDLTKGPAELISPADGTVFSHYPRTTTLTWKKVPGASGYRVEVQFYGGGWVYMRNEVVTGTSYTFPFIGAQPGRWRVTPIDGGGVQGTTSAWWGFRYTI